MFDVKPFYSFTTVLFDTITIEIAIAEHKLCLNAPLICGFVQPFCSLSKVLFDTITIIIPTGETDLRIGMSEIRGYSNLFDGRFIPLCLKHSYPFFILFLAFTCTARKIAGRQEKCK